MGYWNQHGYEKMSVKLFKNFLKKKKSGWIFISWSRHICFVEPPWGNLCCSQYYFGAALCPLSIELKTVFGFRFFALWMGVPFLMSSLSFFWRHRNNSKYPRRKKVSWNEAFFFFVRLVLHRKELFYFFFIPIFLHKKFPYWIGGICDSWKQRFLFGMRGEKKS